MELILIGSWIGFTVIGCCVVKLRGKDEKLRVMSCRRTLRQYKKLDEADNKSLF